MLLCTLRSLLWPAFAGLLTAATLSAASLRTWTNTDGRTIEAEAVSLTATHVGLRRTDGKFYSYPRTQLSAADQDYLATQAAALPAEPPAELVKPTPPPAPAAPAKPAPTPKLTADFAGKLVERDGSNLRSLPPGRLEGVKYYAIYFGAGWCPPCQAFSPQLVEFYERVKKDHPEFELVFVSSDETEGDMLSYMKQHRMPWPALRLSEKKRARFLQPFDERGIPNLVFVDAGGNVLARSYVDGNYRGPRQVLPQIEETLAKAATGRGE